MGKAEHFWGGKNSSGWVKTHFWKILSELCVGPISVVVPSPWNRKKMFTNSFFQTLTRNWPKKRKNERRYWIEISFKRLSGEERPCQNTFLFAPTPPPPVHCWFTLKNKFLGGSGATYVFPPQEKESNLITLLLSFLPAESIESGKWVDVFLFPPFLL